MAWTAFIFPLELEVREGVSWLHVLAFKSGISIFDHAQVAYFGMHGAIDPLMKTLVSYIIPLPSHSLVRLFVLTLPFCLLYMCYEALRPLASWRWPLAIASATVVYIGTANMWPFNMLVGRPDPTILSLLALQGGLTARFLFSGKASRTETALYAFLIALEIFTIWRILPTAGSLFLMAAICLAKGSWRSFVRFTIPVVGAVALVGLALLLTLFDGEAHKFYQHFIGIFMRSVSAQAVASPPFELFPSDLMADKTKWLAVFVPFALSCWVLVTSKERTKLYRWTTLSLVIVGYLLHVYGYHKNRLGGGIYYLSPYMVLVWCITFITVAEMKHKRLAIQFGAAVMAYLLFIPNWSQITTQTDNMITHMEAAGKFRAGITELFEKGILVSEDYQLFKNTFKNSGVDNGDGVEELTKFNFFTQAFRDTGQRFFDEVKSGKYEYFYYGGVTSLQTRDYLKTNYVVVAKAPPHDSWNGPGGCVSPINCPMLLRKK